MLPYLWLGLRIAIPLLLLGAFIMYVLTRPLFALVLLAGSIAAFAIALLLLWCLADRFRLWDE